SVLAEHFSTPEVIFAIVACNSSTAAFVKAFFNFYRLLQIDAKIFVETCEITSHVNKMHIFL
uniref:hypothetical protein n=1 Tax=Ruminococcus sp. TaxID=41978 RepID=UPI003AB4B02D